MERSATIRPLLTVAAGIFVGALGVRVAKSARMGSSVGPKAPTAAETAPSGSDGTREGVGDSAPSHLSVLGGASADLERTPRTPLDRAESVIDPRAAGLVREESASRISSGKTGKASRKTKPGQAPA